MKALARAMKTGAGARVAVVAVQGMAGVGKSFLVEQFCAKNQERLGTICRWVLDPEKPPTAAHGLLELAQQAGLDVDGIPVPQLAPLLNERPITLHIDNVDSAAAAAPVVELLRDLPSRPAIVTGRYTALGTASTSEWRRVEVECLDVRTSVAMLRKELGKRAPSEAQLRRLASELGGLPLALHLAAGYLRCGYSADAFLRELHSGPLALPPMDSSDPITQTRSRGVVAAAFEISKRLLLGEAKKRGQPWEEALAGLGWAPLAGFGVSLGAAIANLSPSEIEPFLNTATLMSIVRRQIGRAHV
jgi:hypothetical protein